MEKKLLLLTIGFLVIWIVLGIFLSTKESPTFDEPVHVKAGYEYLRGNFEFDPIEPPLLRMIAVMPTKYLGLNDRLDYLNYRLSIIIITGLSLSALVGVVGKAKGLKAAALLSGLIIVEPNLLSYGHLVTTDTMSGVLVALTLVGANYFPSGKWWAITGALAAAIKVASLPYLFIGFLVLLLLRKISWKRVFLMGLLGVLMIWGSYGFRLQSILSASREHNQIANLPRVAVSLGQLKIPLGGYSQALKENWQFAGRGQSLFFAGRIYDKGPFWKQVVVYLLKTPWPVLVLLMLAVKEKKNRVWVTILGGFFLLNAVTSLHFGMRHQLVISILALMLVAITVGWRWVCLGIIISGVLVAMRWPNPMTFSNWMTPLAIHSDSDYDWGQGLIELKQELGKRGINQIQLGYFGNNNPEDFGINYERIRDENPVETKETKELNPEMVQVISVTCYQRCGYRENPVLKTKKMEVVAGSLLMFK